MSRAALRATRTTIYRWIFFQSLVVLVVTLLVLAWQGTAIAVSFLLGSVLCILPNGLVALWWFANYRVSRIKHQVTVFYLGEFVKLFLIGFLFVMAQQWLDIHILVALIGFIGAQVAFWLAPLVNSSKR